MGALHRGNRSGQARSIHIMTFVFSLEELAEAILQQMDGRSATRLSSSRGIFEKRNSTANWSQLASALHCAGAEMRQDGNPYTCCITRSSSLTRHTVITGLVQLFQERGCRRNDENIVIIRDATIAELYLDEWKRRLWDSAR